MRRRVASMTCWQRPSRTVTHYIHCNALQHTATHWNALQHTETYCNTLQQELWQVLHHGRNFEQTNQFSQVSHQLLSSCERSHHWPATRKLKSFEEKKIQDLCILLVLRIRNSLVQMIGLCYFQTILWPCTNSTSLFVFFLFDVLTRRRSLGPLLI